MLIRRSDNMWDFRKLGDEPDNWTPMGEKPTMWNEPGNVIALPAPILAAREFITAPSTQARLDQLIWSHLEGMELERIGAATEQEDARVGFAQVGAGTHP